MPRRCCRWPRLMEPPRTRPSRLRGSLTKWWRLHPAATGGEDDDEAGCPQPSHGALHRSSFSTVLGTQVDVRGGAPAPGAHRSIGGLGALVVGSPGAAPDAGRRKTVRQGRLAAVAAHTLTGSQAPVTSCTGRDVTRPLPLNSGTGSTGDVCNRSSVVNPRSQRSRHPAWTSPWNRSRMLAPRSRR